jgi:hypothetical protein
VGEVERCVIAQDCLSREWQRQQGDTLISGGVLKLLFFGDASQKFAVPFPPDGWLVKLSISRLVG